MSEHFWQSGKAFNLSKGKVTELAFSKAARMVGSGKVMRGMPPDAACKIGGQSARQSHSEHLHHRCGGRHTCLFVGTTAKHKESALWQHGKPKQELAKRQHQNALAREFGQDHGLGSAKESLRSEEYTGPKGTHPLVHLPAIEFECQRRTRAKPGQFQIDC